MNATIEVSAYEQSDLLQDLEEFGNRTSPYPVFRNPALTTTASPPQRYQCEVPADFLEKFPRWKTYVVTGPQR